MDTRDVEKVTDINSRNFISMEKLSELTGLSPEVIENELFDQNDIKCSEVSMDKLREIMVRYLNKTLV